MRPTGAERGTGDPPSDGDGAAIGGEAAVAAAEATAAATDAADGALASLRAASGEGAMVTGAGRCPSTGVGLAAMCGGAAASAAASVGASRTISTTSSCSTDQSAGRPGQPPYGLAPLLHAAASSASRRLALRSAQQLAAHPLVAATAWDARVPTAPSALPTAAFTEAAAEPRRCTAGRTKPPSLAAMAVIAAWAASWRGIAAAIPPSPILPPPPPRSLSSARASPSSPIAKPAASSLRHARAHCWQRPSKSDPRAGPRAASAAGQARAHSTHAPR